jgi:hypothetical protein
VGGVVGRARVVDGAKLRIGAEVVAARPTGPVSPAPRQETGADRVNGGECPSGIGLAGWAAGRSRDRVAQGARKVPPRLRPDGHDAAWQLRWSRCGVAAKALEGDLRRGDAGRARGYPALVLLEPCHLAYNGP